jgi:Uncharacterized protein conserved in bacteria (DUF2332)
LSVSEIYAEFAVSEARGVSPVYERLGSFVATDPALLDLLPDQTQPQLLFGIVRLLGGPVDDPVAFREFTISHWPAIASHLRGRTTQTNEPGRCAVLLPVLASLPQPLALLEVGASAGLCLYPDRYAYRYGTVRLGSGEPVLESTLTGIEPPSSRPEVVWRAGIDLNPLDVTDPADVAWLEALIWPDQTHRRDRLRAAASIAAAEPPLLVRGDLLEELPALAAQAPAGATLVVFHTSVFYQVPRSRWPSFVETVHTLPGHWLSNDVPELIPDAPPAPDGNAYNLLALDGVPLAWTRSHGQALTWIPTPL